MCFGNSDPPKANRGDAKVGAPAGVENTDAARKARSAALKNFKPEALQMPGLFALMDYKGVAGSDLVNRGNPISFGRGPLSMGFSSPAASRGSSNPFSIPSPYIPTKRGS